MISDSSGISLNIATLPVAKKKNKNKNTGSTTSNADVGVGIESKKAKVVLPKTPKIPKPSTTVSNKPSGILKNPKPAVVSSIWKKFKHANKKDDVVEPTFVKPVTKPERLVKKKVKVKDNVEIIPPSETFSRATRQKFKKSENTDEDQSIDPNSDENNFKFLSSDFCDDKPKIDKFKKDKSKNQLSSERPLLAGDDSKSHRNMGKTTSLFVNNPEIPSIPHRAVQPIREAVFSNLTFEDMELHPFMVKYLKESMGLTKLTTVQEKSIPVLLGNRDALIRSQTGSGKTLAFALPILHKLQEIRPKINRSHGVLALIIVPTRELALQVYEVFNKLVKSYTWIVPGYLVGGEKRKSEKARLRKGISILIGTPGRLIDHVQHTKALSLDKVSYLVIDEADRLTDMGYEKDVSVLLEVLDKNESRLLKPSYLDPSAKPKAKDETRHRQTVLLSATLSQKVEKLAGLSLKEPVFIDASDEHSASSSGRVPVFSSDVGNETEAMVLPEGLVQKYVVTPPKLKLVTLASFILRNSKLTSEKKMLIFIATQDMVDYYAQLLSSMFSPEDGGNDSDEEDVEDTLTSSGIKLFKLHGNMKQTERTEVFKTFRKSHMGVLLCTDVASRGLDLPEVDCVIQYTGPTSVSDYVHRVGRTARGGQTGSSVVFLTPNEVRFIEKLENCQIRLREEKMESCLGYLLAENPGGRSLEEEATKLQSKFESLVTEKRELYDLGCKAFASWSRFYASYPRNMRDAFNVKDVHQGHFAKSFALRDTPSVIVGYARKKNLNDDRSPRKRPREKTENPRQFPVGRKNRLAEISEFDSGLAPLPKRRKK